MDRDAVILAIGSPAGFSKRGLVRGSGAGVFDLLRDRLVGGDEDLQFERKAFVARMRLGKFEMSVIVLTMPGPASFTGEDTVELLLPGNPMLLERVIDDWIACGATLEIDTRRAGPGEFSARAFMNNKLSLTEAEGVNAIITARSDAELRAAKMLTSGRLGDLANAHADRLARSLALVEAAIDFTDVEDVVAITAGDLLERVTKIRDALAGQLERAVGFESLRAIPRVVLVGSPNAGKSTLFNALLGQRRVVVSDVAGTTRDVIEEPLRIGDGGGGVGGGGVGGGEVMLVDMAGLDDDDDMSLLNPQMQAAAREAIERADVLVECVSVVGGEECRVAAGETKGGAQRIRVATKGDLLAAGEVMGDDCDNVIVVSAQDGFGLAELVAAIGEACSESAVMLGAETLALQPRHDAALRSAVVFLDEAIAMIEIDASVDAAAGVGSPELVAASLRSALDAIGGLGGSVGGDISPDDVLGHIFAGFCVGK